MDSTQIKLPGSEVSAILVSGDRVEVAFGRAYLIKTMTGSVERTRWWQAGHLVLEGVSEGLEGASAFAGPLVCQGGDIEDNIYTYRDMIPIPFESRGSIRFLLRFEGFEQPLDVWGRAARLTMRDVPKYIEHLRDGA